MSDASPASNRRDFLSGRAIGREVQHAGEQIADALLDAGEHRPAPLAHDTVRLETRAMACQWSVIMNPGPPQQVMTASDALDMVHALEAQLTIYRDDSELMQINREAYVPPGEARQPPQVEAELFALLQRCREWAEATGGAFDPTSGPLIALWRRSREEGRIPTSVEIDQTLRQTGIRRVQFDDIDWTVRFPVEGFRFDLGGVGKGYAIDRAAEHLQREGVADYLIHGGHSSLYATGDHAGQGGWPIGIKNPLFTDRRYATLLLQDRGMSTSGSNIQFFRHQGKRYGHILDPRTGWPAHSPDIENRPEEDQSEPRHPVSPNAQLADAGPDSLLSATVLAPTAAEADALSTAFYVLGLEKARDYCHNHPEVSAILIPPPRGRTLSPVVCGLPDDALFLEESVVGGSLSVITMNPPQPHTTTN